MRKRKSFKGVATLLILVFLLNFTFIPSGYANDLSGHDKVYAGQRTYSQITALPLIEPTNNIASEVYSNQTDQAVVHKEIEFPALPSSPLLPGKQGTQSDGVFMKHVIHMPKVDEKPVPYTPIDDRVQNGQNPEFRVDGPGIASSVNGGIISSSPNSLVFEKFNEMAFDETDLNLVDDDAAENPFQALISHIDSIPDNAAGSVTGSMYNNVTYDMYNDGSGSGYDLPPVPADSKENSVVSSVYTVSDSANNPFPIHNKAGRFSARFPRQAGSELFQFSFQNSTITLGPLNPAFVPGIVDKNRILYEEIYPSTDMRYTVEQSHLKEELIVKKYTGQRDFFFNIDVKDAVYRVSSDSTILFYDPASGQPLFYIPKGYAIDSNGNRCDAVSLEFTEEGLLKLSVDANWLQNAAYPVMIDPTIYLFDATFTRSSTAYRQDGTQVASGTPRYEAGKFGQGVMVEEGTTNLLTASQSSFEDGVINWGGTAGASLSVDSNVAWSGSKSMKFTVPLGGDPYVLGIYNAGTSIAGKTYTFSTWIKQENIAPGGIILYTYWQNAVGNFVWGNNYAVGYLDGTRDWYRLTVTATAPAGATKACLTLLPYSKNGVGAFWVDGAQIEEKSYATSWQIGGTTRSSEKLTIPTAGIINQDQGTIELLLNHQTALDPNGGDCILATNGSPRWDVWFYSGAVKIYSGGTWYSTGFVPTVGVPYRLGITWSGTQTNIYIDGVKKVTANGSISIGNTMFLGSYKSAGYESNAIVDDLAISSVARTDAEMLARGTSSSPLLLDAATTCKLNFDGDPHAYPIVNPVSITFSRSSIAYKQDGTQVVSGTPRYEAAKFNQGIMIEERTTNLLTVNQSSVETDITGFTSSIGAVNSGTMTRTTTKAWQGNASLKIDTTALSEYQGASVLANGVASKWYNGTAYVWVPSGVQIQVGLWDALNGINGGDFSDVKMIIGNNAWQKVVVKGKMGISNTSSLQLYVRTPNATATTFYVDGLQIEYKDNATSWVLGGTTRSPESLTIPTAGIINQDQGSIEILINHQVTPDLAAGDCLIATNGSPRWEVWFYSGAVKLYSGGDWYSTGFVPTVGVPYRLGITWSGTQTNIYIDGVKKVTANRSISIGNTIFLGSYKSAGYESNAIVDDLAISSIARTDAEMLASGTSSSPLLLDAATTCKLNFDNSTGGYTIIQSGSGIEPYWNYTSTGLGGGWQAAVNTWNLNLILSKPLFLIPGRGMPIGESITYNSNLGGTWTFGNNTRVSESPDGSVTYNKSDGGSYTFTPNGSGGYTAPPGVYLTLQKNGSGNFTILDKNKNTYNYVNGKPNQFKDRNDNITTFTYDGNGRLYQVSDPSGRKLTYAYSANGQVSSITDPANRAYQFGYQNGILTTITDPDNNTYTLGYDANGRVTTFTDPLNRVTTFVCTPAGQITGLRDARTNGQDVYETSFTQTLEGSSIIVKVTDPGNKISTFYHDNNTGNMTKFQDGLGNTWQYVWENNNLKQTQDVKGQTTYQYDSWGNVISETTTVDGYSSNNITKTMTYDDYNQLLEVTDGSGRKTSYKYSNKGELLSTLNPELKESNGRKYDQYGNVVEYSPGVLGDHKLIFNGSMEIAGTGGDLLSGWTRVPGGAATTSREGFNAHGNYALKISSSTVTTDRFKQTVYADANFPFRKLTLRADVKLDNVQPSGSNGGAVIRLDYGIGNYEEWYCWGTGTVPMIVTSQAPRDNVVTVHIGLSNASGTVWFDGVQLQNSAYSGQNYVLSSFDSIENGGLENLDWNYSGTPPTFVSDVVWEGSYSLKLNHPTNNITTFYQDVPVYGGEPLTFSGMVKTDGVNGNGAYYKIDYYNASNNLLTGTTVQTGYVTGTQDWTRLTTAATAPANAQHARVQGILDGSGVAYFDAVKLIPRNSKKYIYDTAGNYVNTSEDASGKQQSYTYNQDIGNMLTFTDALNRTTTFSYDNLNRLIQVTDPLTIKSYYDYDSVSNLVYSRDPRSTSSTDNTYRSFYGPDSLNRLSNLTDPLNRNATYIYDRSGNLTQISLPNGLEQEFEYDGANRLVKTIIDGGKYFSYAYDGANGLTGVTDQNNNTYSWSHDGAHRLTSSTDALSYTLNYGWDKSNNMTGMSGSGYGSIQYNHGSDSQLLYVILPDGYGIFYDYDENGRIFNVRYPGSYNYRKINYVLNGWVSQIQDPSMVHNYDYYYNDNGTIWRNTSWTGWEDFAYDANGRLTSWYYSPWSGGSSMQENYAYDAAGNLMTKGSQTFTYNGANQITKAGYTYDANGNMTGDGSKIYIYNALNQLTQVKRASDNVVIATYVYNHNGLRKSKTVSGVTTTYNWDASGNLVRETTAGVSTYFYYVGGKLVGLKKNGTTYIVHDNLRGDVESITDVNGNIVAQAHYDPWGNQISSSGSLAQPMRYAGYYFDEETGLYYLKSRYYSPTLGRFLTRDDIDYIKGKNPQTLNLYSYCLNNPVSNIDPEGTNAIAFKAAELFFKAMVAWLGLEAAKDYIQQTKDDIWAALQEGWEEAKTYFNERSFNEKLDDIQNNPDDWSKTREDTQTSTGLRNKGGTSVEEEFTNNKTGERIWKHTLKDRKGKVTDSHYRPYPKQIK